MSTKVTAELIKEKGIVREPRSLDFNARMSVNADERNLFIGSDKDFKTFVELMEIPPKKWEQRLVHKRYMRSKDKPLLYEEDSKEIGTLVRKRADPDQWENLKKDFVITKELENRIDALEFQTREVGGKEKRVLVNTDTGRELKQRKKIKLFLRDREGDKIPFTEVINLPIKGREGRWNLRNEEGKIIPYRVVRKYFDGRIKKRGGKPIVDEYMPNDDGTFTCSTLPAHAPALRVWGPLPVVREITKAVMEMFPTANILSDNQAELPDVGDLILKPSDVNLSKIFVNKSDRDSGALCKDVIRSYMYPTFATKSYIDKTKKRLESRGYEIL